MGGIKSGSYAQTYRLLLLGVSPAQCAKAGMDKATIRKLVVFKAHQNKKMTLEELSKKTGINIKTCWGLKQISKQLKE